MADDELLLPVSAKVPGGVERRTSETMRRDLLVAKKKWGTETENEAERERRKKADFLEYEDENGRFADFHSNRHTFITNLERAGLSARLAEGGAAGDEAIEPAAGRQNVGV